jgi:C1A family cysteine protease
MTLKDAARFKSFSHVICIMRKTDTKKANNEKNGGRKYGWIRDAPDARDFLFKNIQKIVAIPAKVDLRPGCSPVEDQGRLGSCTANALAGALEFLELKDKMKLVNLSRLFIYFNERVIEGNVDSDSGAQLRDGIKVLAKLGVCPESEWKYVISKFKLKPPQPVFADALRHKILSYYRIQTLDEMKNCLANDHPFVFGFVVFESFESSDVAHTGNVGMPKEGEKILGGHAVVAVGYDDSQKRFIVRNSWGSEWGMNGYFTIPYEYLANPELASDMWVILKDNGF